MSRPNHIIGIDPDVDKSGVAHLSFPNREIELLTLPFPQLLDWLVWSADTAIEKNQTLIVVVEAGWKVDKSNFHDIHGRAGQKLAKNVGANHETGKKIIEMCEHFGIEVIEQHPLKKTWKGRGGKITHEEIAYFTEIKTSTNQEVRDALLIAWCFANLPIRVKIF